MASAASCECARPSIRSTWSRRLPDERADVRTQAVARRVEPENMGQVVVTRELQKAGPVLVLAHVGRIELDRLSLEVPRVVLRQDRHERHAGAR